MRSFVLALSIVGFLTAGAYARREEVVMKDAEYQIEVSTVCRGDDAQITHCKKNLRTKFRDAIASSKKARAHETAMAGTASVTSASPKAPVRKERPPVKISKEVVLPASTNGAN